MRDPTEKELDLLYEASNKFWEAFSALCHEHLNKLPEEIREYGKMMFGEKTSIYGIAGKKDAKRV